MGVAKGCPHSSQHGSHVCGHIRQEKLSGSGQCPQGSLGSGVGVGVAAPPIGVLVGVGDGVGVKIGCPQFSQHARHAGSLTVHPMELYGGHALQGSESGVGVAVGGLGVGVIVGVGVPTTGGVTAGNGLSSNSILKSESHFKPEVHSPVKLSWVGWPEFSSTTQWPYQSPLRLPSSFKFPGQYCSQVQMKIRRNPALAIARTVTSYLAH